MEEFSNLLEEDRNGQSKILSPYHSSASNSVSHSATTRVNQLDGFEQRVVWMAEKLFFVLRQRPNRKSDGIWSRTNPHYIIETNDRNGTKVMLFVSNCLMGRSPLSTPSSITQVGQCLSMVLKLCFEGRCVVSLPEHGNTKAALVDAGRCNTTLHE